MIAAAILTGGHARRLLGQDKSRLVTGADGRTILDRQLAMLAPVAADILIVTSAARLPDFVGMAGAIEGPAGAVRVRVVADRHPGTGPLGAIVTALDAADADAVFVIGGDMPDVPAALVSMLADRHDASGDEVTVPESARGLEPLAAIYARRARAALLVSLEAGELSLQRALKGVRIGVVSASDVALIGNPDRLFRNINTPDDLA